MRHLAAVPATPPRAVLYLRQSTHREESISLELQETAGRDYCERMGYEVVAVEADPGISGRTWNRPAVRRVMDMIESGRGDVIVLWKWSRLSRSRRDWAIAADRVDVAGGRIESSTEALDVQTSTGRLARGMMTEFAAFESERIGDVWREAHARRVKSGRPANGKPRWGYAYNLDTKTHYPDPEIGPVLAETYRRYVAGESVYSLVRWLNREGYKTPDGFSQRGGGPWSERSLRRVLDSGFGAGFFIAGGERLQGVHEPVIDQATWEAYLAARVTRRVTRSSERSQYLMSGMVRCHCGSSMQAGASGTPPRPKFRCRAAKEQGLHPGVYVEATVLEREVLAWLREVAGLDGATDAAARASARAARRKVDATALAREAGALQAQLVTLTRQHITGVIPESAYVVLRDELEEQVAAIEQRRLLAAVDSRRAGAPEVARKLLTDWDLLPVEHRRGALATLIRHVVVVPGRPRGRLTVVAVWDEETPAG